MQTHKDHLSFSTSATSKQL